MLSASSASLSSSRQFKPPQTQSGHANGKPAGSNPLTELIHAEKSYLETLKIIDSQIAPIWIKQTQVTSPEFSELLQCTHDILICNKLFCVKLIKVSALKELGSVLMQWVEEMEAPYMRFAKAFIWNLDQRNDILSNSSIRYLLKNLSANVSYEVTLESLFSTPLHQLNYYKLLYDRLLDSTQPGRPDHTLLLQASQRITNILHASQINATRVDTDASYDVVSTPPSPSSQAAPKNQIKETVGVLLPQRKRMSLYSNQSSEQGQLSGMADIDLATFENQVDYSNVRDIFSRKPIVFRLHWSDTNAAIVVRNSFILVDDRDHNASVPVHLILTTVDLAIFEEIRPEDEIDGAQPTYALMYPPVDVRDVMVKAVSLERELIGEYLVRVILFNHTQLTLRAESKEIRNLWVTADAKAASSDTIALQPMTNVVRVLVEKNRGKAIAGSHQPLSPEDVSLYSDTQHDTEGILLLYAEDSDEEDAESNTSTKNDIDSNRSSKATDSDIYDARFCDDSDKASSRRKDTSTSPNTVDGDGQSLESIKPRTVKLVNDIPTLASAVTAKAEPSNTTTTDLQAVAKVAVNNSVVVPEKGTIVKDSDKSTEDHTAAISTSAANSTMGPQTYAKSDIETQREIQQPTLPAIQPGIVHTPIPRSSSRAAQTRANHGSKEQVEDKQVHRPLPPRTTSKPKEQQTPPVVHHPLPRTSSVGHMRVRAMPNPPPQLNVRFAADHYPRPRPHFSPPPFHHPMSPHQQMGSPLLPSPVMHHLANSSISLTSSVYENKFRAVNFPHPHPSVSSPTRGINHPLPSQQFSSYSHPSIRSDDSNVPPLSAEAFANATRQVLFVSGYCEVFHWKDETWYAAESPCSVQVRLTNAYRTRLNIQLLHGGQIYLDTWILPNTVCSLLGDTDVSLAIHLNGQSENYLFHFSRPEEAREITHVLQNVRQEASQQKGPQIDPLTGTYVTDSIPQAVVSPTTAPRSILKPRTAVESDSLEQNTLSALSAREEAPQTLVPLIQCQCKLFSQNEHSNWSNLGNVHIRVSLQMPSKKTHIFMANGKTRLASGIVPSYNVEMMNSKRITVLLNDEKSRTNKVYMIDLRKEQTAKKVYEYLKTRNDQNGW